MIISFVGSSTSNSSSATAIAISHGISILDGDVVIVAINANGSTDITENNIGAPLSRDLKDSYSSATFAIFSRVAGTSEPAVYNFELSSAQRYTATLRVYRGCDTSNIYDVPPLSLNTYKGNQSSLLIPSITTNNDKSAVVGWIGADSSNSSKWSGFSNSFSNEAFGSGGTDGVSVTVDKIADFNGPTGTLTTAGGPSGSTNVCGVLFAINVAASGPTITGPDSTTEGSTTVQAGTLQDTIVTQSLISGSYSIEQTIESATAGTLTYNAESGVNQCTPSTPVSGVPLEPTITAAGITPYVVQQEADDGANPPATRDITLNPEATHEVIQTMAGVANTTPDQSIFGTNIIIVEDDMQAYVPKTANGMTITWAANGTFSTGMVDQTEVIDVAFFSPATGQWSCIALTIQNSSIVSSRSSFDFPNFQFPILDTTH